MQVRTKQRLIGLLILLAIVAIFLPLLFHNSRPSLQALKVSKIPPKPIVVDDTAKTVVVVPPTPPVSSANQATEKLRQSLTTLSPLSAQLPDVWAIKLATFNNVENAKRLTTKLRGKGFDVYSRSILDVKGHRLLRVYVGPQLHRKRALQLRDELNKTFHIKGIIVKYQVNE